MTRRLNSLAPLVLLFLFTQGAWAATVWAIPSTDTYVSQNPNATTGQPYTNATVASNTSHGLDTYLFVGSDIGNGGASVAFLRFDLSAYAGQTVTTDGHLVLDVAIANAGTTTKVSAYQMITSWNNSVTYNPMPKANTNYVKDPVSPAASITGMQTGPTIDLLIPKALIQSWIDSVSPGYSGMANNGLMISTNGSYYVKNTFAFYSREVTPNFTGGPVNYSNGPVGPVLSFNTRDETPPIPEPSTIALAAVGLALVVVRRRFLRN